NLEIVNGVKKHTRDVGMTFPTPGSSEARVEEDSDVASWSEDKIEEKMLLTNYLRDRKSRKNKQRCCEGRGTFFLHQESLWLHRPDFISRSGERIKRLKLIVQERKLQNMLQSERKALFNTVREWQGYRSPMHPLSRRGFLDAQKNRPVGKKEMIQRSKRIYEQLPEVRRKKEEEKRRSEYKSYRLRAQLYKKVSPSSV
ncbi:Alstrom syndrome protein 1, partial [Galemys pyrenaicus]